MKNKLICGDNLEILATMEKESVDLIYIDPPFFSNRNYEIIWGDEAEIRSFEDRWEGGINVYINWMKQKVIELHRVLKPTGSFYLHCDWHASHYLKVMCDEVFDNFQNEIVWCYKSGGASKNRFSKKHDTIFFYTKTNKYNFNLLKEKSYNRGLKPYRFKGIEEFKDDIGWHTIVGMKDWWEIDMVGRTSHERLGYPTQKPEALLERIISASSNKEDVVLDAFCGCGTALAVAHKLGRKWIGIDISPSAIALIKNRMNRITGGDDRNYEVIGMPQKIDDLRHFKPYEFQYWVINEMHGTGSPRKTGDMGIDGLSFLEHYPIQVKQSESIGRNVIDNFQTAIRRYCKADSKNMKGYIVGFSFGKGAHEEVARVKKEGIEITLVTVQDILDKKYSIIKGNLF